MRGAGFDDKIDKKIRDILDRCLKEYRLVWITYIARVKMYIWYLKIHFSVITIFI